MPIPILPKLFQSYLNNFYPTQFITPSLNISSRKSLSNVQSDLPTMLLSLNFSDTALKKIIMLPSTVHCWFKVWIPTTLPTVLIFFDSSH